MSVSLAILSSINEAKNDLKVSDFSDILVMYSVQNGERFPFNDTAKRKPY